MIGVICEELQPRTRLAQWVESRQRRFQIQDAPTTPDAIRLRFTDACTDAPWRLKPTENLVIVSSWRCADLARYVGCSRRDYLLLTGMLALTQYRALTLNPLLKPVDFIHRCEESCLFVNEPNYALERFLLATEQLAVCRGCADFYHCLGVDPEWLALTDILDAFDRKN